MTIYVPFAPSNSTSPPFTFQATLDNAIYNVTAAWNFDAQRWYITITDQSNTIIASMPLVGSPSQTPIETMTWAGGLVTVTTAVQMGYRIGSLVDITVTGANPSFLSGLFPCTVIGAQSFTYAAADPVQVLSPGSWSTDLNLIGAFFETSTMIFRSSTQNFEIGP